MAILDETGKVLLTGSPIMANVTHMPVSWGDTGGLKKLVGQEVRLRFEIKGAKLYSFVLCFLAIVKRSEG